MINNEAVWDPSTDGPIESIALEIDAKLIEGGGDGQRLWMLIRQGGEYFVVKDGVTGSSPSWHTMSLGPYFLDEFCLIVPPGGQADIDCDFHPDCGPDAEPSGLGFSTSNSTSWLECQAYDNWRIEIVVVCPADLNDDGVVNTGDLLILLGCWGLPCGDLDFDGDTDTVDLLALLGAWGECP